MATNETTIKITIDGHEVWSIRGTDEYALKCPDCEHICLRDDVESDRIYECGDCGHTFPKSQGGGKGNLCPECNKFGTVKFDGHLCPECNEGEMEEIEARVCEDCSEMCEGEEAFLNHVNDEHIVGAIV